MPNNSCLVCNFTSEKNSFTRGKSCPCCGVTYGFEDTTNETIKIYRACWIDKGMPWFNKQEKPSDWEPFNQLKKIGLNYCSVCWFQFETDFFPWGEDGRSPTFTICPCCGVEYGYEDSSSQGIKTYRKTWLEQGANWLNITEKPKNWNSDIQLKRIENN
ncbi:hypothetical protein [Stenoxybacter acetivorans]|uniref:hypothetical protein n=1 Tax=Stenoxybacter acetivorans TaxID=422441 RepID=UPI001B80B8F6|nr:hypothetical protein [Stenoxybacter acetivorans]